MGNNISFGRFEKEVIPEMITGRILAMIEKGELRPGDKLPPERDLAQMIGVSRPSLREALRALSIMNVIEIRQGAGAFVSSLEPLLLTEHFDFSYQLEDKTYLDLLQVRKILEKGIAEIAAVTISDDDIEFLEEMIKKAEGSVNDLQSFLKIDFEIHNTIIKSINNPILEKIMSSINRLGIISRQRTVEIPGVPSSVLYEHKEIVAALKAHNPQKASIAMLSHITNIENRLKSLIEQDKNQDNETLKGGK